MVSRFELYRVKRRDNLSDSNFWNPRFQDIDVRLNAREGDATRLDDAVDALEAVALQRLADTFTPLIVEAQARLNNLGASFSAESLLPQTVGLGAKAVTLTEATAANYVYTDYVQLRSSSTPADSMLGQVVSFDRPSGILTLTVVHTEGTVGATHSDWLIRVGAPIDLSHADRTDNPHMTTAAQVGAWTIAQAQTAISVAIAAIPGVDLTSRLAVLSNLADLNDKAQARVNLGLKALALLDAVGYGDIATNVWATAANFRANLINKGVTTDSAWGAAVPVDINPAIGTVTLDLSAGINFRLWKTGALTLANPINPKVGQSGSIMIQQSATVAGGAIAFGDRWFPLNERVPVFSTVIGAVNYITYQYILGTGGGVVMAYSGGKLTG